MRARAVLAVCACRRLGNSALKTVSKKARFREPFGTVLANTFFFFSLLSFYFVLVCSSLCFSQPSCMASVFFFFFPSFLLACLRVPACFLWLLACFLSFVASFFLLSSFLYLFVIISCPFGCGRVVCSCSNYSFYV